VVSFSPINGFQPEHYEFFLRNNPDLCPLHIIIGLYLGNDLDSDVEETIYDYKNNSLALPYRLVFSDGILHNDPEIYRFPLNHLVNVSSFATIVAKTIGRTHFRSYLFKNKLKNFVNEPNRIELELGKENLFDNRAILSLVRLQKLINERGSKLTILLIPQNYFFNCDTKTAHIHSELKNRIYEVRHGNNILKATKDILTKLDLDYYDPKDILKQEFYFRNDAHWNREGHFVIGTALADYIRDKYYK
jgi:hypothetical protein